MDLVSGYVLIWPVQFPQKGQHKEMPHVATYRACKLYFEMHFLLWVEDVEGEGALLERSLCTCTR